MKKAISFLLVFALLCALPAAALAADAPDVGALPVRWLDYESVEWWDVSLRLLQYGAGGKVGLCRTDGTTLTGAEYDMLGWLAANGGVPVQSGGKWGKVDLATGALTVPCVYSSAQETYDPVDAQIVGAEGGPYAVAALDGTLRSAYKYWDYRPFCYGLACVCTADGWGYVDASGTEVLPCRYSVEDFGVDGYALVKDSAGWNIVDRAGRMVLDTPLNSDYRARPWSAGHGLYGFTDDDGRIGFVNAGTGEIVIEPQFRMEYDPKGYPRGGCFNAAGYALLWDADGREVAVGLDGQAADAALAAPDETSLTHSGGLHSVYDFDSGKWGFADADGAQVVPCVFDSVYEFYDGVALVKKGGVSGLLTDPRSAVFLDVAAGAWYAPYVEYVAQNGIMIGTGDGMFAPERELTKMECLTLVLRLYDLMRGGDGTLAQAPEEDRGGFRSVSDWQIDAAAFATRQEFVLALAAAAGALEAVNGIDALPDTDDGTVLDLYRAGILNGVDAAGTFAPEKTLTRAEAAAMAARVLDPSLRIKASG